MKILHVMAGKENGGAELYSKDVMIGLHEQGVEQIAVVQESAPGTKELRSKGVSVVTSPLDKVLRPAQRLLVGKLIEREKPDIVHCWMRRAASLVPSNVKQNRVVVGWFGDYEDIENFKSCDQFVGVTKDLCEHMVASGIDRRKTMYIPTFSSVEDGPALSKADLQTPESAPVVLTLSRLHPTKGIDNVLKALIDLKDYYLWVAGDGPLRGELHHLATKLGVISRVRFLGWRNDRGRLLRSADLCVLPSRYEPFGTVIIDAWYARTPLVACDSAGPKAHVRNGVNGMLVPRDDPRALQNAIKELIKNNSLRNSIVETAYQEYHDSFSREVVVDLYKRYYERIKREFIFEKYRRSWLEAHCNS